MDDHIIKTVNVYDKIAASYAQKINTLAPTKELDKFVALVPQKGHILDVGCAAGRDSLFFTQKNLQVTGIDLSEKLLEIAKLKAPLATFMKVDLRSLPFQPETFAGIWASAVLLHLKRKELPAVIGSFHKLLKKSGVLMISLKLGRGEENVSEDLSSGIPRLFTFYQPEEIRQLLTVAKFSVQELYTWNQSDTVSGGRDLEWISCFARKL